MLCAKSKGSDQTANTQSGLSFSCLLTVNMRSAPFLRISYSQRLLAEKFIFASIR